MVHVMLHDLTAVDVSLEERVHTRTHTRCSDEELETTRKQNKLRLLKWEAGQIEVEGKVGSKRCLVNEERFIYQRKTEGRQETYVFSLL